MRFNGCSAADLEAVAAALGNGRLRLPPSQLAIERLGLGSPNLMLEELTALAQAGFRDELVAELLRIISAERRVLSEVQSIIDLVVTGPDVRATARDTGVVVEQLFGDAQAPVLVVGFALYKGSIIFRRLADRLDASPNLNVTLCLDVSRRGNDTTRNDDIIARYAHHFVKEEWPGRRLPKLYFDPRGLVTDGASRAVLHAKCVVIDRQVALVTSANPTPAAYERNIEVGLIVRRGDIPRQIHDHFETLIARGHLMPLAFPHHESADI
jgi:phosphatidylserine/phosphatidylglycerophosphate/cardiolipin synthase-like enzyme